MEREDSLSQKWFPILPLSGAGLINFLGLLCYIKVAPSVRPSVTNRVSAISDKLLKQI